MSETKHAYIDYDASYALILAAHQKRVAKAEAQREVKHEPSPEEQKERINKQREYARQWYRQNMADLDFRERRRKYAREWYARNCARSRA